MMNILQQYLREPAADTRAAFRAKPALWTDYHDARDAYLREIYIDAPIRTVPSHRMILELEDLYIRDKAVVADLGCGADAPLARYFAHPPVDPRYTILSYDHCSGGDPFITEADIAHLPLKDDTVDIAILCMSLWGTDDDCMQYVKEARRVVKYGGRVYIMDTADRFDEVRKFIKGAGLYTLIEDSTTEFCYIECSNHKKDHRLR